MLAWLETSGVETLRFITVYRGCERVIQKKSGTIQFVELFFAAVEEKPTNSSAQMKSVHGIH